MADASAAAPSTSTPSPLAARFKACVERVRATPASAVKLGDGQRLELYGLYKQATEGDNGTKAPGLLDFVGRSKWNAWKYLAGLEADEAMQRYVARVAEWFPPAGEGSGGGEVTATRGSAEEEGEAAGGGGGGGGGGDLSFGTARVSSMGAIGLDGRVIEEGEAGEEGAEAEARDVFYFAKRGLTDEVIKLLEGGGGASVDAQDEEGRSLLHWAVDGGHEALAEALLARGATVGLRDSEGDTPLDYAELCEYTELAARLRQAMETQQGSSTGAASTESTTK